MQFITPVNRRLHYLKANSMFAEYAHSDTERTSAAQKE